MVEDNSPVLSTSASSTPNWAHARWGGRLGTVKSFKIQHPCPLRVHQCVAVTAGGMVPAARILEQFTATIISHDQFPPPYLRPKTHIIRAGNQALTAVQARVSNIFNLTDPSPP